MASEENFLDEDGYPTEEALDKIAEWDYTDETGWFEFIKELWHLKEYGWEEKTVPHPWKENTTVYQYHISTAGWSGNEDIIRAMTKNHVLWSICWVQSRRGGHYIFEKWKIKYEYTEIDS